MRAQFMVWPVLIASLALLTAVAALLAVRRAKRRLDQLQQSYWDLRYEHGRLKAQVQRLDPEAPEDPPTPAQSSTTFIPLSSLKR
jgi:hypothetical protein